MLQLMFMSVAADGPGDIRALCDQAAVNNARAEITGVLLYENGHYLQVIEGPRDHVEDTFLRIMVDPRHADVLLLSRRLTTVREFGGWSMRTTDGEGDKAAVIDRARDRLKTVAGSARARFDAAFGVAA